MEASKELIVPTGLVHERLGIRPAPAVPLPTASRSSINIRRLNVVDDTPARGRWVDGDALILWLGVKSMEQGGVAILEDVIRELKESTGL